jgi:hypothetical protein
LDIHMNYTPNSKFRWLYGLVVGFGISILILAFYRILKGQYDATWFPLSCLALFAGCFTLKIPGMNGRVSASDTIIFMSLMLFGPYYGAVTAAMDGLAGSLRCKTKSRRLQFVLYNSCSMAISAFIGGHAFQGLTGKLPLYHQPEIVAISILLPLGVLALVYYGANTFLVAGAVALEKCGNILAVWREGFQWTCVNYLAGAGMAGFLIRMPNPFTFGVLAAVLIAAAVVYIGSRSHLRLLAEVQHLREKISSLCASPNAHPVVLLPREYADNAPMESSITANHI